MANMKGFGNRYLPQRDDEITEFVELLKAEGVRRYLEIGLQRGLTFHFVGSHLDPPAHMVGIDLPGAEWGVKDGTGPAFIERVQNAVVAMGHHAKVIWGDSKNANIIAAAKANGPYDIVFIDGDHRPAGVLADWENYRGMARMVAFHDIDTSNFPGIRATKLAKYGVEDLWHRIKGDFEHVEFIGEERGMGIGVLWTGL